MAKTEVFRTSEGEFRILVTQVIDGATVDWHLVERKAVASPDKLVAHIHAVQQWLHGAAVNWTGETTESGYEFVMAK